MSNKYLARLNLTSMLSNDETQKAGIGHNMGDELDNLGTDVTDFAGALKLAAEFKAKRAETEGELRTVKIKALVATAQAAHSAGIKYDNADNSQWRQLVAVFSGAVTKGSIDKESSVLKRAVELQGKRLLTAAVRAAENMVAAAKASGKTPRAMENVFESVASVTNKTNAIPTYDEMVKAEKLLKPSDEEAKAKREAAKLEREEAARKQADIGPDDVAARFIAQFLDVAKSMDDASFDKEVADIAEALRAARAKAKAEAEAKAKADEAASAKDVGGKGSTRRRGKQAA